jgi:2,4-dienoyl-CoA reductase-like NADH-dependent reductase (Old Yellow Enzyme family)
VFRRVRPSSRAAARRGLRVSLPSTLPSHSMKVMTHLLTPIPIGRSCVEPFRHDPMTRSRADQDGLVSDLTVTYHARRAGLITSDVACRIVRARSGRQGVVTSTKCDAPPGHRP